MPQPCEFCGQARDLPYLFDVFDVATDAESTRIGYCSEECRDNDDGAWRPVLCDGCDREIRLHAIARGDIRHPATRNFCLDASGNPLCRVCAGTQLQWERPLEGDIDKVLPDGWDWWD